MEFAKDDFYNHLKNEVNNSEGDGTIFFELDKVLKKSIYFLISKKVPESNRDDVYQNVFFAVWRSLPSYLQNFDNSTEAQRAAWLYEITRHKIADFYEREYKKTRRTSSIEAIMEECQSDFADSVNIEEIVLNRDINYMLQEALLHIFSLNTSPEKIIGFVYAKIILFLDSSRIQNGKPSEVYEILSGKSLFEIRNNIKYELEEALGKKVPESIFLEFDKKLLIEKEDGLVGERLFSISVKTITDGTNRIQKKIQCIVSKMKSGEDYGKTFGF